MSKETDMNWDPTRESLRGTKHAYEIEGQAITVAQFQEANLLRQRKTWVVRDTVQKVNEAGADWWKINGHTFYGEDCNEEAMISLQPGQVLQEIVGMYKVNLGKGIVNQVVAAMYAEEQILYCSPGFNEKRFLEQVAANTKESETQFTQLLEHEFKEHPEAEKYRDDTK